MNQAASLAKSESKTFPKPLIVVVMGVSGCGKTTVAQLLTSGLQDEGYNTHCKDGDELHPESNIAKMESGTPLTDEDRQPWLVDVAQYARTKATEHGICVIACSALKRQYRETLNTAGRVVYVFLKGSYETIAARMHQRKGHFMPEGLLDSQFNTLEDPTEEPSVVSVSIEPDAAIVASNAIALLKEHDYLPTDC